MGQIGFQSGDVSTGTYISQSLVFASPRPLKASPHPSLGCKASLILLPPPRAPQYDCKTGGCSSPAWTFVLIFLLVFQSHTRVKQDLPETSPKATGHHVTEGGLLLAWKAHFSPLVSTLLCPPVPLPTGAAVEPRLEFPPGAIPHSDQKVSFGHPKLFPGFNKNVCSPLSHRLTTPPAPLTVA